MDLVRVHDDVSPAVIEALALTGFEELVAADNERSHEIDGPCPKAGLEVVALFAVTQLAEPVDDLAVTVIELGRPLARALLSLSPEQAPSTRCHWPRERGSPPPQFGTGRRPKSRV